MNGLYVISLAQPLEPNPLELMISRAPAVGIAMTFLSMFDVGESEA